MKRVLLSLIVLLCVLVASSQIVITGVIDGPLSGGTPKAVELYVTDDIADLSIYGIGSANNGGGTDGEEFTFPADAATAGDFIYVAYEPTMFMSFFGFAPDYTAGAVYINGDDAIELFKNGSVIDVFGDISSNSGSWVHTDGWAYRKDETGSDGTTFTIANWSFSGKNALDGETTNATASFPFPIGTYSPGGSPSTPAISASPALLTNFVYAAGLGVSQTFTIEGSNLTGNITITPPTNYEIGETPLAYQSTALNLTPTSGSVLSTTIYARLKAGLVAGDYNDEEIVVRSAGATNDTVFCSGTVAAATTTEITVDPIALSGFYYDLGKGPSDTLSFTVEGSGLTENLLVTAPTNFEISSDGSSFQNSIALTQSGGSVSSTKLYARLIAGKPIGIYGPENINCSSTGATQKTIVCSGLVVDLPDLVINEVLADPDADLAGDANGDGTRHASDDEFVEIVNNGSSSIDMEGFYLTDASSTRHVFPAGTIIPAGDVIVVFGGGTPTGFNYGTVQTASSGLLSLNNGGDVVTLFNPTALQITAYAYGGDGGDDQSLTRDPDITGSFVKHSSATGSGGAMFSPTTKIDGTPFVGASATPTVAATPSTLTGFTYVEGSGASGSQTFAVSGSNLTSDVSVTPTTNYEISEDGSSFQSMAISLSPSSGALSSTDIYVRLIAGKSTGEYNNEEVVISSTGADNDTVFCSGSVTATATPIVNTNVSSLSDFAYLVGNGPSGSQLFTVSGSDLTADVSITPSVNYEVSDDNSTFQSTVLTLAQADVVAGPVNVYVRLMTGLDIADYSENILVSTSGATSKNVTCSGKVYDIPNLVINEVLADPDATKGDANGDGVVGSSQDEFVEIINNSDVACDLSGFTISDGLQVRHIFPEGTVVPANNVVVVFGGGTPTGIPGVIQTASTGSLSLNNAGDIVLLHNSFDDLVDSYTYGGEGGDDQSLTRIPDVKGDFGKHTSTVAAGGAIFSPGTRLDGSSFTNPIIPSVPVGIEYILAMFALLGTTIVVRKLR